MSALDRLAERMFGRQRLETTAAMASVDTQTYIGVATSDSADGSVSVVLSDDVTQPDNGIWDGDTFLASDELGTSVELPTTTAVREGDRVLVTASGANVLTAPVVTGVVGRGDEQQAQIDAAAEAAASVEGIAQEALDDVEQVRQDVADFRSDVATTYATKVEREDGDDAVRTFITTNYTNSNDLATTYATKTLVSQTKDAIELAASQTYETQTDAAATYATKSALTVGLDGIRSEVAEDYQPKGDYATTASMNSAIQQSASSIESSVAATYETKSDAATTYATKTEVQQTASGLDTRITTAQSTADGAASTASTASSNAATALSTANTANGNATTALNTANDALADSVEYIIGTQTAATNAWTGQTRDAALVAGKTIAYKLPYAGTGTAATLNLTLSGGGTTGAKGVRRMADNNANYTVTTQYGAGAVIQMTYDGEFWRVSSGYNPSTDINNARYRTQIPSAVKAAAAYTNGHIICGTSAGYKNIGAGVAFDLGYPLLWATANVAAGATGTSNYLEIENRVASNNGTIQSGAANKTLYLKGTVSGNTFTIAASPFMTTVVPTSEDSFCYIPLGLMLSATNIYFQSSDQLYAYTEGAFQPIGRGALATAQAEVTERQTLIRQFSGGVLAGYVGNAIAALVNAAGSFDVVEVAWANGVPSILSTLATFGANLIRIGGKFAASGRSTAKVQFFEDNSALTDLTAEHYLNTTTDPQVSHDLALSATTTDDELPDGTGRTVTGNVEVWEQVYHSGSTYSDEVMASLNGMTTNRQNNVSIGVQAIESSGASSQRIAFVTADTVRLTSGTGSQSVTSDTTMPQVRAALNCRSDTNGWVNSDGYANSNRAIYVGARVNNSASSVNGHNISLYLGPAGLNLYDGTAGRTLWNFGLNNPHFAVWAGTKVMTINASSFTLFTKAQLQAIVGTDWTPTGANCSVFVMNGDHGVTANMMSASIDASSVVRVHMNANRNGSLRVNYLIIRFAA